MLGLRFVCRLSPDAASGGRSSSRCTGLSLSQPLPLRSTGPRRAGSAVVAHGPSRSVACGIFPDQGSNPCPLHWQADSQPLRHQGSPILFKYEFLTHQNDVTSPHTYTKDLENHEQNYWNKRIEILNYGNIKIEDRLVKILASTLTGKEIPEFLEVKINLWAKKCDMGALGIRVWKQWIWTGSFWW